MQSLPLEVSENVLLQADTPTLISLCGTSAQHRSLCSDSRFWRKRFEQEGLPLLEQGYDARSWIRIYQKSHQVAQLVEGYLEEDVQNISFQQIDLDELSKIVPSLVETYVRQEEAREELIRERDTLDENTPKDVWDDFEAELQIIPEYSLSLRSEGETYALDVVFYTPFTGEYDYSNIDHGLSPDDAFVLLFSLLYQSPL
nr:DNA-directed RNA polymerase subunit [Cedratvirus borely]